MYISYENPINKIEEIKHFEVILNFKSAVHSMQTVERWNERAIHWENSIIKKTDDDINTPRITNTVEFLEKEKVFENRPSIIDIGGGIGVMAASFSKKASSVLVLDFASEMCNVGKKLMQLKNKQNVDFLNADFFTLDIDEYGFKNKFDLVFAALSPSIKYGGIDKCLSMSRKYFANQSFVSREIDLYTKIGKDVFGKKRDDGFDGHWYSFYSMVNLLFLKGYYPKVTYIKENTESFVPLNDELITDSLIFLSRTLGVENSRNNHNKIEEYLKTIATKNDNKNATNGLVEYKNLTTYGVALVDVREKTLR